MTRPWGHQASTERDERAATAISMAKDCLTHPFTIGAVVVLLVNDHLLKGYAPSWLTGKLSDFAGLFFFPFLVALVVALLRLPRPFLGATITTVVGFGLLKTAPAAASGLPRLFPWSTQVVADPTDLIALLSLLPAAVLWRRTRNDHIGAGQRHAALQGVVISIAAFSVVATSSVDHPAVRSITDVGDDLYAVVSDAGLDSLVYSSSDSGATWTEVEEPSRDVIEAIAQDERAHEVRCDPAMTNVCFRSETRFHGFEESFDGGITWVEWSNEQPPDLFGLASADYIDLRYVGCVEGTCWREIWASGIVAEKSQDGGDWTELGEGEELPRQQLEQPTPGGYPGRCEVNDANQCYRATRVEEVWLRSDDGGLTWPVESHDRPEVKLSGDSGDRHQVRGAACITQSDCFRVFAPEGSLPRLQESHDRGTNWRRSWSPSPRLAGRTGGPYGVPQDLAVVGEPGILAVALDADGILRFSPNSEWTTDDIGDVPGLPQPSVADLEGSPVLILVWTIASAMTAFGLFLLSNSFAAANKMIRPWWVGIPSLFVGLAAVPVAAFTTAEYPYGFFGLPFEGVLLWSIPALVFVGSTVWARRSSDEKALRLPLILVFGILILGLVSIWFVRMNFTLMDR